MLIILLLPFCLCAVNQMALMTTISGEHLGSYMGYSLASLDFNGDGIKDLVVLGFNWSPSGVPGAPDRCGKLYFFYGGAGFDNVPEWTIEGQFFLHLIGYIFNGGDINGDGKEDLVMGTVRRIIPPGREEKFNLYIFYGRDVPQAVPDYNLTLSRHISEFIPYPLGDINNDGCADLATISNAPLRANRVATVILGGSFTQVPFISTYSNNYLKLSGIGDVNGDGIDDFHLFYPLAPHLFDCVKLAVYFGGSGFPDCDSLTICENTNTGCSPMSTGVGDVNGDGIGDFASFISNTGAKVWFGRPNLSSAWDVALLPLYFKSGGSNPAMVYGDLNGDGYDDIIGSDYIYAFWDGRACVWLGREQFNGTVDLYLNAPLLGQQFGWAKVAGDFNADGYCDVAISSPCWHGSMPSLGFVYVYAGNAQLADTTVGAEDELAVPATKLWSVKLFPNPLKSGKFRLHISFTGSGYKTLPGAKLTIADLKGRRIYGTALTNKDLQSGEWQSRNLNLARGLYLVTIKQGDKILITKKLVVSR